MFAGNVRYVKQECSIAAYLIYKYALKLYLAILAEPVRQRICNGLRQVHRPAKRARHQKD